MIDVLAVGVVVAATHHGADGSGLGVEHGHARLEPVDAHLIKAGGDRRFGCRLHVGVDGGLHGHAAGEDRVVGELVVQELAHVIDEIGIRVHVDTGARGLGDVERDGLGLRGVMLFLGDVAVGEHAVEYRVATLGCEVGVHRGVIARGRVGKAHEQRRLGEREVGGALGEICVRRGFDAVGAVTKVDGVEVHHQDLVFGVDLLHLEGEIRLAHLALDSHVELLVGEDRVAHELLGDGGCALGAAGELHHRGARDAVEVDAVVLVEALVLGIHRAGEHVWGDLVDRDALAVLRIERGDLVAVRVEDGGRLAGKVEIGIGVVGKILQPSADVAHHADAEGDAGDEEES